jgi:hypothetical protein
MIITPKAFLTLGLNVINRPQIFQEVCIPHVNGKNSRDKRFRALFGVSCDVCSHVWEYVNAFEAASTKARPHHLLWCLLFVKTYASEAALSTIVGVTEKTFRLWVWRLIASISSLYNQVVSTKIGLHYLYINLFDTSTK